MSNHLQNRTLQDRRCAVARAALLTDAAAAQLHLAIAESARDPARARWSVARACEALVHITSSLRTLQLDADVRDEIEQARNALRLRLARIDRSATKH